MTNQNVEIVNIQEVPAGVHWLTDETIATTVNSLGSDQALKFPGDDDTRQIIDNALAKANFHHYSVHNDEHGSAYLFKTTDQHQNKHIAVIHQRTKEEALTSALRDIAYLLSQLVSHADTVTKALAMLNDASPCGPNDVTATSYDPSHRKLTEIQIH